jgi:hypothetical protein
MTLAADTCEDDRPPVRSDSAPQVHPGALLRQRREQLGLSIDDVSRATKISGGILRAIEAMDIAKLPARAYARGFVRSYAREVGLNPETTVTAYWQFIEAQAPGLRPQASGPRPQASGVRPQAPGPRPQASGLRPQASGRWLRISPDLSASIQRLAQDVVAGTGGRGFSRVTFAIAAAGLAIYVASFYWAPNPVEHADGVSAASTDGGPADSTPEEHAASGIDATPALARDPDTAASTASLGHPLRLEFVAEATCWVAARVDGEVVFARLMEPGDRYALEIGDEVVLRVGEPGALSLSINGQSARPLGRAGQPVTVRITADNFREFLTS